MDNLSPDLGSEKESEVVIKGATERVTEGRSRPGHLEPQIEVILELIFSKNTLPNKLADLLSMKKLEL